MTIWSIIMTERISLRCEICPICGQHPTMLIERQTLKVDATGSAIIADVHGLAYSTPHVRILFVDAHASVRSFQVIKDLTGDGNILAEIKKLKGMYPEKK